MTERVLNIGFAGNGKSANRYHIPYLLARPETMRVKTIYARHPDRSPWPHVPGVVYTEDWQSLLQDPELDVIVLSTPPSTHGDLAEQVLCAGKHCVVEKPFVDTYARAAELFALARQKGLLLECYQNRRFDSDFLTLQKVLTEGKAGDVYEIRSCFDYYRPEIPRNTTALDLDHSFLYGHGSHLLDQAISILGSPERVCYATRRISGHMTDAFDIDLYYQNGTLKYTVSGSYFRVVPRPRFTVYGTEGTFCKTTVDLQETHLKLGSRPGQPGFGVDTPAEYGTLVWYDGDGGYHEEKVPSEPGDYGRFYDALRKTIVQGGAALVQPGEILTQVHLLEEIRNAPQGGSV